jgi:hypothetical protein
MAVVTGRPRADCDAFLATHQLSHLFKVTQALYSWSISSQCIRFSRTIGVAISLPLFMSMLRLLFLAQDACARVHGEGLTPLVTVNPGVRLHGGRAVQARPISGAVGVRAAGRPVGAVRHGRGHPGRRRERAGGGLRRDRGPHARGARQGRPRGRDARGFRHGGADVGGGRGRGAAARTRRPPRLVSARRTRCDAKRKGGCVWQGPESLALAYLLACQGLAAGRSHGASAKWRVRPRRPPSRARLDPCKILCFNSKCHVTLRTLYLAPALSTGRAPFRVCAPVINPCTLLGGG